MLNQHFLPKKIALVFLFCLMAPFVFSQNIQSPNEFLPHKIGEQFTPHHLLVDYFEYVAENSDQVILQPYGRTNEDRPMMVAFVSTKENLAKLEEIRTDNLKRAGIIEGTPNNNIPIVWLSYSVHGNEAAGSESSMPVLYELASGRSKRAEDWLRNTLVVIDPAVNPDGYSRYTHWVRRVGNKKINTLRESWEHNEPWPGGRMNHYLFDLNRDWAWQTQVESQQRMAVYNEWLPQVHADVHEMSHNDPYYFAPAAQPYHEYITKWQSDFQSEIGRNHAKYFDREGWLYYTKEIFDLLYPSYGDTYPIFNGAIGMTYEQGGSGVAGRAVDMNNGEKVTLLDRVNHHKTTSLSTIEMTAKSASRLLENFENYFKTHSENPVGKYKSFVIKGSNAREKIIALTELLDKNKIRYGLSNATDQTVKGFEYVSGKEAEFKLEANDLIINAFQPKSVLVQVLFEPEAFLVDSMTYDITAWSLPYAYGLEAFAVEDKISKDRSFTLNSDDSRKPERKAYAYLLKWQSLKDAKFLGALLDQKVTARVATSNFTIEGNNYKRGTVIIARGDNRSLGEKFDQIVWETVDHIGQQIIPTFTGFSDSGADLGSESLLLLKKQKVAVLTGEGTSPFSFGQIWHYFETDLEHPISAIPVNNLQRLNLNSYTLLILPEGRYRLSDDVLKKIRDWVSSGGRVIAIGSALSRLEGKEGFKIEKYATEKDKKDAQKEREQENLDSRLDPYAHRSRKRLSNNIPGAIFKLNWDNTHPLGYGMSDYYFSLKTGTRSYQFQKNATNVGYTNDDPLSFGFVGSKAKETQKETTVFAVQNMGRGNITYMVDNPLYRGFWYQGKILFSNAVFINQ